MYVLGKSGSIEKDTKKVQKFDFNNFTELLQTVCFSEWLSVFECEN